MVGEIYINLHHEGDRRSKSTTIPHDELQTFVEDMEHSRNASTAKEKVYNSARCLATT